MVSSVNTAIDNNNFVNRSPFFEPSRHRRSIEIDGDHDHPAADDEPKCTLNGATFNLMNSVVGAGIVGMPYVLKMMGFRSGLFFIIFCAYLTVRSLRMLLETARLINVTTFERLCGAAFEKFGFVLITSSMFVMSYGAMISYLIIIKSCLPALLSLLVMGLKSLIPSSSSSSLSGSSSSDGDGGGGYDGVEEMISLWSSNRWYEDTMLTISSLLIILPLSLQRDIAKLAKTSTLSVTIDCIIVLIVVIYSPIQKSLAAAGGLGFFTLGRGGGVGSGGGGTFISESSATMTSLFSGLGVLSFAFVCQHSAFIIATSLNKPTKERWGIVTGRAINCCAILATIISVAGYLGYGENVTGNILNDFGTSPFDDDRTRIASYYAKAGLCVTMFFVYPVELFVARHACVVTLFKGRDAFEGNDRSVLARLDRRFILTVILYSTSLITALIFDDLGKVLAATGALGGSSLCYVGPGLSFLGIHGGAFLEHVEVWLKRQQSRIDVNSSLRSSINSEGRSLLTSFQYRILFFRIQVIFENVVWYIVLMPLWCTIARTGADGVKNHFEVEAAKSPYMHQYRLPPSSWKREGGVNKRRTNVGDTERVCHMYDEEGETRPLVRADSLPMLFSGSLELSSHPATSEILPSVAIMKPPQEGKILDINASYGSSNATTMKNDEDLTRVSVLHCDNVRDSNKNDVEGNGNREKKEVHDSPQVNRDVTMPSPSCWEFFVAIFYVTFGLIAASAGLASVAIS